jgi:hypothetical protein
MLFRIAVWLSVSPGLASQNTGILPTDPHIGVANVSYGKGGLEFDLRNNAATLMVAWAYAVGHFSPIDLGPPTSSTRTHPDPERPVANAEKTKSPEALCSSRQIRRELVEAGGMLLTASEPARTRN